MLTFKGHLLGDNFPQKNAHGVHVTLRVGSVVAVIPHLRRDVSDSAGLRLLVVRCARLGIRFPRQSKICNLRK